MSPLRSLAKAALALLLAVLMPSCVANAAEFQQSDKTTEELRQMTEVSISADWEANLAFASGVGRVTKNTAQAKLLARRAALLDAQRNLLLLRKRVYENPAEKARIARLSGAVPPVTLVSERMEKGLYFVDVKASLSRLLGKNFSRKQLQEAINRLAQE